MNDLARARMQREGRYVYPRCFLADEDPCEGDEACVAFCPDGRSRTASTADEPPPRTHPPSNNSTSETVESRTTSNAPERDA